METLKVIFNRNDIAGKNLLAFLEQNKKYIKTMPFVSNEKEKIKKMSGLDEAIKDIEEGRVSEPMTIEEFKVYIDKIWNEANNEV